MTVDAAFLQERRLIYWNRFLDDAPPQVEEIDRELLPFAHEISREDREAYVLLRTCAHLAQEGSTSLRRTLKAAILFWFSQAGSKDPQDDTGKIAQQSITDLYEVIGCRLTWQQSAAAVGGNPTDYSAYRRLVERLRGKYETMWVD